jgi:hypothetical protein
MSSFADFGEGYFQSLSGFSVYVVCIPAPIGSIWGIRLRYLYRNNLQSPWTYTFRDKFPNGFGLSK